MEVFKTLNNPNLVSLLKEGKVGLLPTDTIYGISCDALNANSVERIFAVKGRAENKPVIVLIANIADIFDFGVSLSSRQEAILASNWPGKVSFILTVDHNFDYLTRGGDSLAFRLPDNDGLRSLLAKTGPLTSTSANPSNRVPAKDTDEAMRYFGDRLDFYVDLGKFDNEASTVVDMTGDGITVLRQGPHQVVNV